MASRIKGVGAICFPKQFTLTPKVSIPAHFRKELGISDSLVRLSVGVEDLADLKADIEQALA